ncbi:MAG: hypothetical protein ACI9LM_003123 [Alteromonadaceae bacterium]|jgi:hypothetical protein
MNKLSLTKIIDNLPIKVIPCISVLFFTLLTSFSTQINAAETGKKGQKTQGHKFRQSQQSTVSTASVEVIPVFTPRSAHSLKIPEKINAPLPNKLEPITSNNNDVAYNTVAMSHKFQAKKLQAQSSGENNAIRSLSNNDLESLAYQYLIYLSHRYKDPSFRANIQGKNKLLQRQKAAKSAFDKQKFARRILAQQYLSTLGHKFMVKGRLFNDVITEIPSIADDKKSQQPNITAGSLNENFASIPDGEELLLVIKIDDLVLDAIFAIKQGNGALIGLDSIFAVLDFPIDVDIENAQANGWFINEQQTFDFALPKNINNQGHILVNNTSYNIAQNNVKLDVDDIYVHSTDLFKWLGFNYAFNFNDLTLTLLPNEPLPLQKKLFRHARLGKISTYGKIEPKLPKRETPYKAIDVPFVDMQVSSNINQDKIRSNYSMLGMGDLAYMTAKYYLNGDQDDLLKNSSLSLERESLDNNLLGPLNLSKISIGDVNAVNLPFLRNNSQEAGFRASNRPIGVNRNFNTAYFDGEIFPDWDIELYHNNVLIETITVGNDGRYEFKDLNLFFGDNNFKMIFYGPQGQVQERLESIPVNTNTVLDNDFVFDFSVTKQSEKVFKQERQLPKTDTYRISAEIEKGINSTLSLQAGYTRFEFADGSKHQLIPLSINIFALDSKFNLGYIQDLDVGNAIELNATTKFGNQAADYRYLSYSEDFKIDSDENLLPKYVNSVKFSGPLLIANRARLNYSFNAAESLSYNDSKTTNINLFLGIHSPKLSISNLLSYLNLQQPNQSDLEILNGNLQITQNFTKYRLRARADYSLEPDYKLTNVSASLLWPIEAGLVSEVSLSHSNSVTRATLGLTWDTDKASIGSYFSYDDDDNFLASLNVRFSLGQDPLTHSIQMSRNRIASTGGISARIFEDINLDGLYNEGEPLIEGARVSGVNVRRHAISETSGIAFLTGLPRNRITDIELDIDSLEDPFWIPTNEGFSFTPRPGLIEQIDIPIVTAGEIDGNVYIESKNKTIDGRYVPLELVDTSGNVILETESEFDGFYLFSSIKPGSYQLGIKASYLTNKNLSLVSEHYIKIKGDGTIVRGEDIILNRNIEVVQSTSSDANRIKVLNLGEYPSIATLKVSWIRLRNQFPFLTELTPVIPLNRITKNAVSSEYPLRLTIKKSTVTATLCQIIKTKNKICFTEFVLLKQ